MRLTRLSKDQWDEFSQHIHLKVFNENLLPVRTRFDYALLCIIDEEVASYSTIREVSDDAVYWQHSGCLPKYRNSSVAFKSYLMGLEYCLEAGAENITHMIANTNLVAIRIALKVGFLVVGTRTYDGTTYLDMHLKSENYVGRRK